MCLYRARWNTFCKHTTFTLDYFCTIVKEQLDRINGPFELDSNTIPCTPFSKCRPTVLTIFTEDGQYADPPVFATWPEWPGTNVVSWVIFPFCDACWETLEIPELMTESGKLNGHANDGTEYINGAELTDGVEYSNGWELVDGTEWN
ncbi:hypothetical protein N7454_006259 [Penicillium verhagenii]|nr:hypothetical protein N7454_006259 [Penicillium verhagenii]